MVPDDVRLADLHMIIQVAFGWTDSHLHEFIINDLYYTVRYPHDVTWHEMPNVDYKKLKTRLSDLIKAEHESIIYVYDFGDYWEHKILVEQILPVDHNVKYPVCLDGMRNGPPEDCGGVGGYYNLLEIMKDTEHEEYERYLEWLGGKFDPDFFNIGRVRSIFQKLKLY